MKVNHLYFLIFSLFQLQLSNVAGRICQPLIKIRETIPVIKKLGETFTMRCISDSCTETAGDTYNFTKLNETTQQLQHVEQGRSLRKVITDYSDGGIYCCSAQCASDTESCCNQIKVISDIEFQVNDTIYTGQNYTASCTITANPRMNLYAYISSPGSCDFQLDKPSYIGQYTTRAAIRINNITSACNRITCSTNLFQEQRKLKLLPSPKPTKATPMLTDETPTTEATTAMIISTARAPAETLPTLSSSNSATIIHKNLLMLTVTVAMLITFRS